MKRFLFVCSKCGFEYGTNSEEPCKCSFCGTVNECYTSEEITDEYIYLVNDKE